VTESMGAVTDHAFEHLGPSDQMIARTRRRLIQAARALRDKATPPPGIVDPGVFRGARSGYFISDEKRPWQEIYARQLSESVRPAEALRAAE
jgi:phthalate 4,5-dioxygenase